MPRKKLVPPSELVNTATEATKLSEVKKPKKKQPESVIPAPVKPKRSSPKKQESLVPVVVVAPIIEAVVEPAKPKKSPPRRAKAVPPVVEVIPEPVAIVEPVKATKPPQRSKKSTKPPQASRTSTVKTVKETPVTTPAVAVTESSPVRVSSPEKPKATPKPRPSRPARAKALAPSVTSPVVETPVPTFTVESHLLVGDEELPSPTWRIKQKPEPRRHEPKVTVQAPVVAPASAPAPVQSEEATAADKPKPADRRNSRNRRQKKGPESDLPKDESTLVASQTETEAVEAEVELPRATFKREKPAPLPYVRPTIEIPANAPQVVLRDGIPTLVRDHKVYPPLMFFGSPSDERRANTVLEELRMASEAGVHLHSFLIDFEVDPEQVDPTAAFAAYMLSKSVEIDPEAQVIFRLVFQAPRGWQDKYQNARYKHADGSMAEPSVCDDEFWDVAKACLERFSKVIRLLPLHQHIMGLHLERGEWFISEGLGYDNSKAAQTKFRDWARTRYNNDEVTLRASWFDGSARFDNVQIPEYKSSGTEDEKFIRSSRKHRRYIDYHLFLSDATVSRIGDLAYTAKEASEGYFLVGASYGYTFEWSHPSSGHLSLGKLLRTPEIDFIAGPPSYRDRDPGGSAAFPCPIDSFCLNGKLYISEEDFKTSLSSGHEPDDFNPTLKTPQALESAHWRGAGVAMAHASGMAWMDLWGNGWLKTNSVWARATKVRSALVDRMQTPLSDPEVAIFIDERALAYLVDSHAFELLVQNVRESVLRAGVSAAFYLLSDLAHREKFPESKLYVFLNAWDIRPDLRAAIKSRLQGEGKILFWLYSAGLFDAGRDSLERAREVTGIALKPQPFYSKSGTTILNRRHVLSEAFPDRSLIGSTKLEPSYFAIPEGATILGEYSQTGLPSFVVKEFREGPVETHWTSVFLGEPVVNAALIRGLAQMAGAHVWNFHEDVVHVRAPFCTIHCSGAGPRAITLPNKFSAYNLLTDEWAAVDSTNLRFTATDGSTHVFLVGPKEELEQLLESDPDAVLTMAVLPPRELNVLGDISNFDVPIMKLDEWMGGGDGDEVAEDWFLRPQQIVEEPELDEDSQDKIGRRRRRRRGRSGSEETATARREHPGIPAEPMFAELGMNVMFRKRE